MNKPCGHNDSGWWIDQGDEWTQFHDGGEENQSWISVAIFCATEECFAHGLARMKAETFEAHAEGVIWNHRPDWKVELMGTEEMRTHLFYRQDREWAPAQPNPAAHGGSSC